ncbi:hypothetical protein GCM10011342_29720 [Aquisalinus flavus]|uniref:Uncharacterized protein n=1 Tax=Aquisalinus flavus TaxID=1526572 RepID=A0A8J2V3T1_9PROT|nr:hypothetical protein [Aquisalinus flavus]MBD0428047.1 hypothetical protein [Aquisalinus flavus]GGD19073.1 hypothetical protein GCM10011342_29720 [Aquisalinus flavus]
MFKKNHNAGDKTPKNEKKDSANDTAAQKEKPAIVAGDNSKPAAAKTEAKQSS